jgi:hypothetical protein
MGVRSKRLFHGAMAAANAWSTVYTAPSGETVLIKGLSLVNTAGADQRIDLGINGTNASQRLVEQLVPAASSVVLNVFFVLQPGDTLRARCGSGASPTACAVYVGGAELEGVAD